MAKRSIYTILILSILISCKQKDYKKSFCYWNTNFDISHYEDSIAKRMHVNHMYIRYFDVDWDILSEQALPVQTIRIEGDTAFLSVPFTPCIFITNQVFEQADKKSLDSLASRIKNRILQVNLVAVQKYKTYINWHQTKEGYYTSGGNYDKDSLEKIGLDKIKKNFNDVLIDCDWTPQTKEKYFYFLSKIKEVFPEKQLSATLRLWQYKYRKENGIPPVDRCLLMCYNLSDIKKHETKNSIATAKDIKPYLIDENYPLILDIVLPLFSWGVVYQKGSYKGVLPNDDDLDNFIESNSKDKISENVYRINKDYVYSSRLYLRVGDEIRIESISKTEMFTIISLLKEHINLNEDSRISFFSWNTKSIGNYSNETIFKFYEAFNN